MTQIIVVDLGTGNLRSVAKAAEFVANSGDEVVISRNPQLLRSADRIILPGQGAIGSWLAALQDSELKSALLNTLKNKPVLGICVGMQALFEHNLEDGGHQCLGVFKGQVSRFQNGNFDDHDMAMKVPQMGWNQVSIVKPHPVWEGVEDQSWFYFVHSYYVDNAEREFVVGETEYGVTYCSAIAKDNIFAIQCHPEKSHHVGLKVFENFINWKI